MSEDMEDISPAKNKGILKLITKQSMSEEQVTMESLVYSEYAPVLVDVALRRYALFSRSLVEVQIINGH